MLEKIAGNCEVSKLCIILLFEADFNQLNKFIGKEMMQQVEENSLVAGEQYGSRHRKSAITQSLNKRLAFDLIWQFKRAVIVCSNNAKSCYDRIIHQIAIQSMYRCGTPKPALVCMFTTIQNLQHHVWTLYGDSTLWAGTEIWAVLVPGIGQGNGARPQIWAVISTPILNLLRQEGYGAAFKATISSDQIQFAGYSFVDDMDLIQTGPTIYSSSVETLLIMQAALDLWNDGLRATGGALVPAKSFRYAIDFRWKSGHWSYAPKKEEHNQLWMTDHQLQWSLLLQLHTSKARRMLGVYLAPDGNNWLQEKILIEKTQVWAENTQMAHLDWTVAWLNITMTLMAGVLCPASNNINTKPMRPNHETMPDRWHHSCWI